MNFIVEKREGYAIITMTAERLDAHSVPELRSELVLLAGDSVKNMILDLTECAYCDTTGLSAILIAHRLCKEGMLILSGVHQSVENMLSIQRFDPPLIVTSSVADGIARLQRIEKE